MKKVLIVFNGVSYPGHVLDFAIKIAGIGSSLLHAVFMKPLHADEGMQYPFPNDLSLTEDKFSKLEEEQTDIKVIEGNKKIFKNDCAAGNIECNIDDELEIPLDDLIEHSKFSDLIIADANDDLGKYSITELLARSHCPVILVQRYSAVPQQVFLAYDGSMSSVHAIKMYSYLFPEWINVNTFLVSVNPEKENEINNQKYLQDWLTQHFSQLTIKIMKGKPEKELLNFLHANSEKALMVMGAYGKKGLSRLFHESLADSIINKSNASLFISHQ